MKGGKKHADGKKGGTKQPASQAASTPAAATAASSLDNEDDDDVLFDEDEFIGVPPADSIASAKDTKAAPKKTKVPCALRCWHRTR